MYVASSVSSHELNGEVYTRYVRQPDRLPPTPGCTPHRSARGRTPTRRHTSPTRPPASTQGSTTDGWTASKVYTQPYTGYDATRTYSRTNQNILGQLIDPAGLVYPIKNGLGDVTNS